MPVINDAVVVNQAYDTSGNGGRKLVMLDNGWLVAVTRDIAGRFSRFQVSKDNGGSWSDLCFLRYSDTDITITTDGINIFGLMSNGANPYYFSFKATTVTNVEIVTSLLDSATNTGNVTLTINEAKTELHAAWSSKNATYPSSFNIRYAKGTINADGSVSWGSVDQVSTLNSSGYDNKNPSIVVANGMPYIFSNVFNPTTNYYGILVQTTKYTTKEINFVGGVWGNKLVYNSLSNTYIQSSPSAIFVPKSINGLANGRIWVAWHGTHPSYTSSTNIMIASSDDNGVTWSPVTLVSSYNNASQLQSMATLTANNKNEVFVLWQGTQTIANGTDYRIRQKRFDGIGWDLSPTEIVLPSSGYGASNPSAFYDSNMDFSNPLFIYKWMNSGGSGKVGFYGSWTLTDISVPTGHIGEKTDRTSLLSYNIMTDGDMTTVTEKINDVVVGTKTLASGQNTAVSLTQAQWDEIRYGKYHMTPESNNKLSQVASDWETGTFSTSIGNTYTPLADAYMIRTKFGYVVPPNAPLTFGIADNMPDYTITIAEFDASDKVLATSVTKSKGAITTKPTTKTIRATIRRSGTTNSTSTVTTVLPYAYVGAIMSPNTLTIEMGRYNKWEYTFDKRLATNDDMLSVVKSVKDAKEVFLPAVKSGLIETLNAKGGNLLGGASFEEIKEGIGNMVDIASGVGTSDGNANLTVNGLGFKPKFIEIRYYENTSNNQVIRTYWEGINNHGINESRLDVYSASVGRSSNRTTIITSNGFSFDAGYPNRSNVYWIAIGNF